MSSAPMRRDSWQAWVAVVAAIAAICLPLIRSDPPVYLLGLGPEGAIVAFVVGLTALFATEPASPAGGTGGLISTFKLASFFPRRPFFVCSYTFAHHKQQLQIINSAI